MKLQASAHATSWVIRRRKSTTEPQLSMNPPANPSGSVPQKQPAHPSLTTGWGGGDEETQSNNYFSIPKNRWLYFECEYMLFLTKTNCKVHNWFDGSDICS